MIFYPNVLGITAAAAGSELSVVKLVSPVS